MEKGKKSLERLMTEFDDVVDLALEPGGLSVAGRSLAGRLDKDLLFERIVQGVQEIITTHESGEGEKLTAENAATLHEKFRNAMFKLSKKDRECVLGKLEQIGVEQTPIDLSFLKS